jgi:hypothetical protein
VQVRLIDEGTDTPSLLAKSGRVEIVYRRPYGLGIGIGQDGAVVVQDLPFGATKLVVSRVEVPGYRTAEEQAGKAGPWEYPIVSGEVTIPMVKAQHEEEQTRADAETSSKNSASRINNGFSRPDYLRRD